MKGIPAKSSCSLKYIEDFSEGPIEKIEDEMLRWLATREHRKIYFLQMRAGKLESSNFEVQNFTNNECEKLIVKGAK